MIENWISAIFGTFGAGIAWMNINWADALPKIFLAAVSAGIAGGMGYLGKLFTVWTVRKIKACYNYLTNKSCKK